MKEGVPLKDLSLEEKMSILKNMSTRADKETRQRVLNLEDQLSKLRFEKEWMMHPSTKELKHTLVTQRDLINLTLHEDEDLDTNDRKVIFRVKGVINALLAVMMKDPNEEMAVIEREINAEIIEPRI